MKNRWPLFPPFRSLAVLLVATVLAAAAAAQTAAAQTSMSLAASRAGQWQGTTEGPSPTRVVLLLSGSSDRRGVVYLLDGDNAEWPHATTSLEITGDRLSLRIANIEASFSGSFSADGALAGAWTAHGVSAPLRLAPVTGDAAWELPHADAAMPLTADPTFEVATIKAADPEGHSSGFQLNGNRYRALNESVRDIVCFAYDIHRSQVLEAPAWVSSEHWTIDSIADIPGQPSLPQLRAMYRKLLTERFGLQMEATTREIPVYAIVSTKDAPRITKSAAKTNLPDATGNGNNGVQSFRYTNITLEEFASELSFSEDRPVVNHTGLAGRYDFRLRWTSSDTPAIDADAPPVLFTAIQEQLGLKVEAMRSSAQVYVIHHVDRPSAN